MSEQKTNEVTKAKSNVIDIASTVLTVLMGIVATLAILGLAAKGLASYLKDMNDVTRTVAAIIGTALLAYAVSVMVVRFAKHSSK